MPPPAPRATYSFLETAEGLAGNELAPGMPAPPTLFLLLASRDRAALDAPPGLIPLPPLISQAGR